MEIRYVNVYVTELERSVEFFERTLGLTKNFADAAHGYASFDAGPIRLGVAQIDASDGAQRSLVGRQTGVGFMVADVPARHEELVGRGVSFPMPPAKQPWGGFMGLFADPDGNQFYLDQVQA
jgi:predicted enzyme related to lactoylglutathione lyase